MLTKTECLAAAHAIENWKGESSSGALPELSGPFEGVMNALFHTSDIERAVQILKRDPSRVADG